MGMQEGSPPPPAVARQRQPGFFPTAGGGSGASGGSLPMAGMFAQPGIGSGLQFSGAPQMNVSQGDSGVSKQQPMPDLTGMRKNQEEQWLMALAERDAFAKEQQRATEEAIARLREQQATATQTAPTQYGNLPPGQLPVQVPPGYGGQLGPTSYDPYTGEGLYGDNAPADPAGPIGGPGRTGPMLGGDPIGGPGGTGPMLGVPTQQPGPMTPGPNTPAMTAGVPTDAGMTGMASPNLQPPGLGGVMGGAQPSPSFRPPLYYYPSDRDGSMQPFYGEDEPQRMGLAGY